MGLKLQKIEILPIEPWQNGDLTNKTVGFQHIERIEAINKG